MCIVVLVASHMHAVKLLYMINQHSQSCWLQILWGRYHPLIHLCKERSMVLQILWWSEMR